MVIGGNMPEQRREKVAGQNPWDLNELLERLGGDQSFLHELLIMFRDDTRLNLEKARKAMSERDFETLARAAHTLKGMLRNLSMNPAAKTAAALETASRESRQNESTELLETLEEELGRLVPEVELQLAGARS